MNHHRKGAKHAKQLRMKIDIAVRAGQVKQRAREARERLAAVRSSSPGKASDLTLPSDRASSPPPALSSSPGAKENYAHTSRKESIPKFGLKASVLQARQNARPAALRKSDSTLERDFFGDD
ncbi:hypothetical protein AURDEDRAFT_115601 [Auricularia subglabra TFB-10046 SS5]|nr:hypothetical protein AURDEDRAFT_115601 [Auricularia subglabra TFB-10046 SS5]